MSSRPLRRCWRRPDTGLRVTSLRTDGTGDSGYLPADSLDEILAFFDQAARESTDDVDVDIKTLRGWGRVRREAFVLQDNHKTKLELALPMLLWLYCRNPNDDGNKVEGNLRGALATDNRACLMVVRNNESGTTMAAVSTDFTPSLIGLGNFKMSGGETVKIVSINSWR